MRAGDENSEATKRRFRRPSWLPRQRLSSGGFLLYAALIVIAYLLMHLAGLRDNTSVLCGTVPGSDQPTGLAMGLGVGYALAYFGFVLAAPILVIAAGVFRSLDVLLVRANARHRADANHSQAP